VCHLAGQPVILDDGAFHLAHFDLLGPRIVDLALKLSRLQS
jgi:hypothetical protein